MNVLYLTLNPNRQSTTVATEGWFRYLHPYGLRPVLVSRELGSFQAWVADQGFPSYQDSLPFPDKVRFWSFGRSLWRLWRIARRHSVHLVHCNEQEIYPIGQYLARTLGVPVVVSVHFTMEAGFCRWAFGGSRKPDRMFFVSRRNLDACRPALADVVPEERFEILHNGLDLERYVPDEEWGRRFRREHGLENEDILIGAASALRPRKQLEHLFQAAAELPGDVKVLLAGYALPEDAAYSAELLRWAHAQLGSRFRFAGSLDDLRGFANALDLYINTSREESFGISVLEAMACGCPVVGYDSRAVDEIVLPDGGEMVSQDDLTGLIAAIRRWIADPRELRARRGLARRQAERFDLRSLSGQLWQAYRRLVVA